MLAFVFVKIDTNIGYSVGSEITKIKGVEEVHVLTGDIDLIVKVSAKNLDELGKTIYQIREVNGVLGTDTRIVLTSL